MLKRFFLFVLILSLLWPAACFSQETMRVALFPFDITSKKDLSYLQTEIPKLIQTRLSAINIDTVKMESPTDGSEAALRKASLEKKCTHAISGHLTWEGNQFHIAAFLMETSGKPARRSSKTGRRHPECACSP